LNKFSEIFYLKFRRKILALYQRWQVSIPKTKSSTQWEDDFKLSPFGGLFYEYLEMGKEIF
jgi:hypothetical protein